MSVKRSESTQSAGARSLPAKPVAYIVGTYRPLTVIFIDREPEALAFVITRRHPGATSRFKSFWHLREDGLVADHLRDPRHGHIHAHVLDTASTLALAVGRMLDIPCSATAHADDIFVNPVALRRSCRRRPLR